MDRVDALKLEDGSDLEIYSNGVVMIKAGGRIKARYNPTELFESISSRGGKSATQVVETQKSILDEFGLEHTETNMQLVKKFLKSNGSDAINSLKELKSRAGLGDDAEVVRVDDPENKPPWYITYDGHPYKINDGKWIARLNIDKQALTKGLWGEVDLEEEPDYQGDMD